MVQKKNTKDCYILKDKNNILQGFLYLKLEDENEKYHDIKPLLPPKKRLKIGTFKVAKHGFKPGERFLKIALKNAESYKVDEIYVTMHSRHKDLKQFLEKWGFKYWGLKDYNKEHVYIKDMKKYEPSLSVKQNFPVKKPNRSRYILPIEPQYHTDLFPDSILSNEEAHLYDKELSHRYALQKNYVTGAFKFENISAGDFVFIYRKGDREPKKYSGCLTTVCVLNKIIKPKTLKEFLVASRIEQYLKKKI